MRFFICFIAVKDYQSARAVLLDFKEKMKEQGEFTVIENLQDNYDFLYNSLIEKANMEQKRGL